jgi:hypothetical protein
MFENETLKLQIQQAKSHAVGKLHGDGMDSLAAGARWFLLLLVILVVSRSPSWKVFLPAFGAAFVLDAFGLDRLAEFLRGKWAYPRIGYVAINGEPVLPRDLPWYLRSVAIVARVAGSLWFPVLFFSIWWGVLLASFGPALVNSIKYDVNRWPRHFALFAAALLVVVFPHSLKNAILGIVAIMVIYLTDGMMTLMGFLRAYPKAHSPSV